MESPYLQLSLCQVAAFANRRASFPWLRISSDLAQPSSLATLTLAAANESATPAAKDELQLRLRIDKARASSQPQP